MAIPICREKGVEEKKDKKVQRLKCLGRRVKETTRVEKDGRAVQGGPIYIHPHGSSPRSSPGCCAAQGAKERQLVIFRSLAPATCVRSSTYFPPLLRV